MIVPERMRVPKGVVEQQTVAWPVTAWRVRIRRREAELLDPFAALVLELFRAGQDDPTKMATMTGLDLEFVRAVVAELQGRDLLDPTGKLTVEGERSLQGLPTRERSRLGWMLRDDLTDSILPVFLEPALRFTGRRPEERRLTGEHAEEDEAFTRPPEPQLAERARFAPALGQHQRLLRGHRERPGVQTLADKEEEDALKGSVELVGSGLWQEMPVDLWVELGQEGYLLRAGCPFGRAADGERYLQRLLGLRNRFPEIDQVLSGLEAAGQAAWLLRQQEVVDQGYQTALIEVSSPFLAGRSLPTPLRSELEDALQRSLRAEKGTERIDKAIAAWGNVAEQFLFHYSPPQNSIPHTTDFARFLQALPEKETDWQRPTCERLALLLPPDDDGNGLEVPAMAKREIVYFLEKMSEVVKDLESKKRRLLPKNRAWPNENHGAALLLLPFLAACFPEEAARDCAEAARNRAEAARNRAEALKGALARDPNLWRSLELILQHRNQYGGHASRVPPDEGTLRTKLEDAKNRALAVLDACFPTSSS